MCVQACVCVSPSGVCSGGRWCVSRGLCLGCVCMYVYVCVCPEGWCVGGLCIQRDGVSRGV